jgi:peptide/nickel transport system permease protein
MSTASFKTGSHSVARDVRMRQKSPFVESLRRLRKSPLAILGFVAILCLTVPCVGAPLFTAISPTKINASAILSPPSSVHYFGTDQYGRDLYSRVLYGGRLSLLVGAAVSLSTGMLGMLIGVMSAYYPRLDNLIMRAMDILMSFPTLLTAMAIMAVLEPSLFNIILAMVFPITPWTARMVRSVALSLKSLDYVMAARSLGAGDMRIVLRHLMPNVVPTLLVRQTLVFGTAVLVEGGLNFLGIGLPPDVPTLGSIVAAGRAYLAQMPWFSLYAGLFIGLIVLSVNLIGDGLRDAFDPRMKV